jgi:hypothetical protein
MPWDADTVDLLLDPFFTTSSSRGSAWRGQGHRGGPRGAIMEASRQGEGTTVQVLQPSAGCLQKGACRVRRPGVRMRSCRVWQAMPAWPKGPCAVVDDEDLVRNHLRHHGGAPWPCRESRPPTGGALEVLKDNPADLMREPGLTMRS